MLGLYISLHFAVVQTWLTKQVAKKLSRELNTTVRVNRIDFQFFNKISIDGVLVEDRAKDTLLYAGNAKLKISDWFFLKKNITIYAAELSQGVVNLQRKDSVWNYQFLVDYFGGGEKSKGGEGNTRLNLKDLHFNNIRFVSKDGWIGSDMIVSLKRADIRFDKIDYRKKQIRVKDVYLEEPFFSLVDYTGKRPPALQGNSNKKNMATSKSAFQWNNSGWMAAVDEIRIFNGTIANDKETNRPPFSDHFDGLHLSFGSISGKISTLRFEGDTLRAQVKLSTRERNGFTVNQILSKVRFTPAIMEFSDLDLRTPKSHLGNYFSMRYHDFNEDMQDFIKSVTLQISLDNATIHSDDIATFAPELKGWDREIQISGNAKGSIDNFSVKKLKAKSERSVIEGELSVRGLPDINTTFIDYKGENLQTNYNDLAHLIPSLKNVTQPRLSKLGNINYKGNFTGFWNDFVTFGTLKTDLGVISADLNMKLPEGKTPLYSGKIITGGFNLGALLNEPSLQNIALNGSVKGAGFTLKSLNANFDGHISQLDFRNYSYQNINVNGNFNRSLFTGSLDINDPNLQLRKLTGSLNLSGKELSFNADADLPYINLKKLGLSQNSITLGGKLSLNFSGNNIDNFLGTARVYHAFLNQDSTRFSFDSLTLSSTIDDGRKIISLKSNELEAQIDGQFTILQLPDAFKYFLSRYYPSYIKAPAQNLNPQDFDFYIRTNQINDYLKLIDPRLGGLNDAVIQGKLNVNQSQFQVHAKAPEFIFDGKKFQGITVDGNGEADTLMADIRTDDIFLSDSLHFPATSLHVAAHNDVSTLHLVTSAGNMLSDAELNASVQTFSDGVKIRFFPSTFILNDKKWTLEKDGELTLRNDFIDANEIKFSHKNQQLLISTELDDITDHTNIVARIENVQAEDFMPFILTNPELKGKLTGVVKLKDPFGIPTISFSGVTDSFQMDNEYLGKVNLEANANTATGNVQFKVNSNEPDYKIDLAGVYNYKDSLGQNMDIDMLGKKVNLRILKPFLGAVFSDISGMASTNLKIAGPTAHPYLLGTAFIDSGSITIDYTQCKYLFKNQAINFEKDLIDFGRIAIKDTLGNTGTVAGKMYHQFFKDFSFSDVRLETSKLLLLNTKKKDNSQFYGNVTGSALMTLNGPTTNLLMNIKGQPNVFDSSHLYLSTGESRESRTVDYIEFIQFGSLMVDSVKTNEATNIIVNMDLVANPSCKIDVILDEETNDVIHGQGTGNLSIRVGNKEPLSIRGRYEITNGDYTFNFQTFLKKPFTLNGGSITWNGDPYQAQIDIQAEYLAKNVDISSLSNLNTGGYRQKEDVTILSHLTGSLKKPNINFEFRLPEKSDASRDYIIVKKLEEFKSDPNEMNKQVASLLLFNSFISSQTNFLTGGSTINVAASTIGGVVSGVLTSLLNKQLQQATDGIISTYVDINPSFDLNQSANQLQANVRAGLQILLSRRLVILLGGNLDYNNNAILSLIQKRSLITPDISIEWLLNKDGSIRVVGFNRSSIDATIGQRNRSGIQLSYRKDFNKLSDIFRSKGRIEADEKKQIQVKDRKDGE